MLGDYLPLGSFTFVRITVIPCPLREGGRPKGGGWIRLAEAGPAKQVTSGMEERVLMFPHTAVYRYGDPSCGFAAPRLA